MLGVAGGLLWWRASAGTPLDTYGAPGAMLASGDGSTVYVALSGAAVISVLDVATATETRRIAVDPCPSSLAISSGRLFYSHGCSAMNGGVASVDPAAPGAPVPAATGYHDNPPALVGAGSTLVTAETGSSAATVRSFTTTADGSAAHVATVADAADLSYLKDLAVTPDGSRLLVSGGSPQDRVLAFTLPALSPAGAYLGDPWSRSIAVSPDGSQILVGSDSSSSTVRLHDAATGALLWHRFASERRGEYGWEHGGRTVTGGVAFAGDGSAVYALMGDVYGNDVRLFHSTLAPAATSTTVTVTSAYGRPTLATATVPGVASGTVEFGLDTDFGHRHLGAAPISNGRASTSFRWAEDGRVVAYYLGDATHLPSSGSARYKVASQVTVALTGKSEKKRGIREYRSFEDVRAKIKVVPGVGSRKLTVGLWRWKKGEWVALSSKRMKTESNGTLKLFLRERVKGKLSMTAYFAGDSRHEPSGAGGAVFTIDR